MRTQRIAVVLVVIGVGVGLQPAWAQWVVNDPTTTARNAVTAVLKSSLLQTLNARARSSASDGGSTQRADIAPAIRRRRGATLADARFGHRDISSMPAATTRRSTMGTQPAASTLRVARSRQAVDAAAAGAAAARRERRRDARPGDSGCRRQHARSPSTHQTGSLRLNGRRELAAIDALERHVIDPSDEQSMTAVLDKVSGAVLIETRQKQARIQLLAAVAEQLIVENKRSRDAEAAAMNMQLGRLRDGRAANTSLLSGAGADLRGWRQP